MEVYLLIFEVGLSSGYKKLLGIFETKEKAEEIMEKHMKKHCYSKHHYSIKDVEVNKETNIIFAEW